MDGGPTLVTTGYKDIIFYPFIAFRMSKNYSSLLILMVR